MLSLREVSRFFSARVRNCRTNNRTVLCIPTGSTAFTRRFLSEAPQEDEAKPRKSEKPTLTGITRKTFDSKSFQIDVHSDPNENSSEYSVRSIKYTLIFMGASVIAIGTYLVFEYGKPSTDPEGKTVRDEYSDLPVWQQYAHRTFGQLKNFALFLREPSREKLLPDEFKHPFYQPPYTLILEFTDVLVHPDWTYQTGWRFKKRPGLDYMLENLVGLFEIVVYTAEQGMTVFPILDSLDPKNLITYKLVRDTTHFIEGHHVKDLDKLNRDLRKVIVVDWNQESVKFHKDNLLHVPRWLGNDNDEQLIDLTSFLKTIASNEVDDVREVLKYYQQYEDPLTSFRQKQRDYFEYREQKAKESKTKRFSFFY